MIRRLILLSTVFILLTMGAAQAQDISSDETWHWAWESATDEVVAYNSEGVVNVLASYVTSVIINSVDSQNALAMLQIGDGYALYRLDTQTIIQLSQRFRGNLEDGPSDYSIFEQHLPYVLMYAATSESFALWIIDLQKNTVDVLNWQENRDHFYCGVCWQLSQDGRTLRYMTSPISDAGSEIAELHERTLASGEDRITYTIKSDPKTDRTSISCDPDTYGEHWLCSFDATPIEYWLLSIDGTVIPLMNPLDSGQTFSSLWRVQMIDNNVAMSLVDCKVDCAIILRSAETGDIMRIPTDGDLSIVDLIQVDDEHFLVFTNGRPGIGILDKARNLKMLGNIFCCDYVPTTSADGHWAVVSASDGQSAQVWDVLHQKDVLDLSASFVTNVTYFQAGILIENRLDAEGAWVYFYADSRGVELPNSDVGSYFDLLPDNDLLYESYREKDGRDPGIYRYSLATDHYTLLISGGCLAWCGLIN